MQHWRVCHPETLPRKFKGEHCIDDWQTRDVYIFLLDGVEYEAHFIFYFFFLFFLLRITNGVFNKLHTLQVIHLLSTLGAYIAFIIFCTTTTFITMETSQLHSPDLSSNLFFLFYYPPTIVFQLLQTIAFIYHGFCFHFSNFSLFYSGCYFYICLEKPLQQLSHPSDLQLQLPTLSLWFSHSHS